MAAPSFVLRLGVLSERASRLAQGFFSQAGATDLHFLDEDDIVDLCSLLTVNGLGRLGEVHLEDLVAGHMEAHADAAAALADRAANWMAPPGDDEDELASLTGGAALPPKRES